MIIDVKIRHCPNCDSPDIIKNGTDYNGSQKYHCHHCLGYGTLDAKARYSQKEKEQVLKAYQERVSMRGSRRIFGVVPKTLLRWIQAALKRLPSLLQTLDAAEADDVLELDELWSFVLKKSNDFFSKKGAVGGDGKVYFLALCGGFLTGIVDHRRHHLEIQQRLSAKENQNNLFKRTGMIDQKINRPARHIESHDPFIALFQVSFGVIAIATI